jgi:hypothetical protein
MRKTIATFAVFFLIFAIRPAPAQVAVQTPGVWSLPNYGRSHGVVTGPGMPKCNPHVSEECRRLYPSLLKKVPRPQNGEVRR